ncbi:nucleoside-diphosphate sugar epimerase [Flavobacteriaceae bacterium F89]|uniref:Nucleoside-diphosphate sugar epimerase n=1 Tax=Cerina litoralis TaxID=2874477 RepID=A0AAE3JN04_9FLAO|nr:nucleoside-diphosphate sugar epimerase [Cerina litoralis]MCG2459344.1 nucleoside-diphosphate sugar epimerase [Cerina litoralis]
MKTAIILGATGLTGGCLLRHLLDDDRYEKIKLFSRSEVGFTHPKMEEYLVDFLALQSDKLDFTGDEVYCCIGTTKAKTKNKGLYRKIDLGIPVSAAKLARENDIKVFMVISALGANPQSNIFYNRIKGEMEEEVLQVGIPRTYILRPSLIAGKREEARIGEWIFKQLMRVANYIMIGPLDKYKSIHPEKIAKCMVWLSNHEYARKVIESDEIKKIALQH